MNVTFIYLPGCRLAVAGCKLAAALAAWLLALGAWNLGAQPSGTAEPANGRAPEAMSTTNLAGPDDMISALSALVSGEPAPAEEAEGTNQTNAASQADNPSSRRPSGRESRSRWSSRQRSNQFGSFSASAAPGTASATNGPVSLDYSTFRMVAERSIFDPNRSPAYVPGARGRDPVYFTLVGTMTYDAGTYAFFSGSSSEYQKSLQCSGTIAGHQVVAISPDAVKLARGTNQLELRVGMQLRLGDNGSWSLDQGSALDTANLETAYSVAAGAASTEPAPSGPDNEILKRLMERRAKE
jgi:hypothetical protein